MEALWNIEDKWKLSTQEAILLFVCTAILVIGLCTGTALKLRARRKQLVVQEPDSVESLNKKWCEPRSGWGLLKRVLTGSVRWSGASKWEERNIARWRERPPPLLLTSVGWQSHNSESPVWQRPILMGEKCELPRFSGLILYDERGQPLHSDKETTHQEKTSTVVRTTLKDLL